MVSSTTGLHRLRGRTGPGNHLVTGLPPETREGSKGLRGRVFEKGTGEENVTDRGDDGEFDDTWADTAGRLAEAAELEAEKTCEACGEPGRARFHGDQHGTWIKALCDGCRAVPGAALCHFAIGQAKKVSTLVRKYSTLHAKLWSISKKGRHLWAEGAAVDRWAAQRGQ
ncbi:hypothetical protein ACFRCI_12745 [Streptomyces sp. NPDC056638]|uniref:hypothetical protein n=1 Tax=Streptomyces sp. NPDC056638 TaxID=3345887 RepID=UPI0036BD91E5